MAEQQPRDALVAHVVERLGAAVGGDDVAIIATVLRDVPALASSVKLTVSARTQQHNTFLSCLNCICASPAHCTHGLSPATPPSLEAMGGPCIRQVKHGNWPTVLYGSGTIVQSAHHVARLDHGHVDEVGQHMHAAMQGVHGEA
jgi:hypothetical protein